MTERGAYENVLVFLNKHKAPAVYVDDFNKIFNKAAQDWENMRYAQYAISQQLEDDLQNLLRVVRINNDYPYPMNINDKRGNIVFGGQEVPSPQTGTGVYTFEKQDDPSTVKQKTLKYFSFFGLSKYNLIFDLSDNGTGYDALYFSDTDTGASINQWMDNTEVNEAIFEKELIIGLKSSENAIIRNYIYGNDINRENIPFSFRFSGKYENGNTITLTEGKIYFFKYNTGTGMFDMLEDEGYISIDDSHLDVLAPPDYLHLIELAIDYRYKNKPECETWKYKTISAARLTAGRDTEVKTNAYLKPKSNRPYYKVENNFVSNKPMFALELGDDISPGLIEHTGVQLKYLKSPKRITLTDEDIELEFDRTDNLEFPEYICTEIVDRCVTLILEKTGDQRIQSQPIISDSNRMSRDAQAK